MAIEPIKVIEALYGAFGQGDVPAILGMLAQDVSWDFVGRAEDYPVFGRRSGRDGAVGFFQALGENEDIEAFEPQAFHAAGEVVVVEGRAALTLKKNGVKVAYDWAHLFTVRDGLIVRFKGFTDSARIVEAYGR
jgi:ketosteroid isomerase-like protein